MKLFPIHSIDGYKLSHRTMMQPGTSYVYENFTPRSNKHFKGSFLYDNKMVVFSIQGFIREFLIETFQENFFNLPKRAAIAKFKRRVDFYLGKDVIGTEAMESLHDLGYVPLRIKALPEGSRVGMQIPVMTIASTVDEFAWLVGYLETVWSNSIWKGMTNATIAFEYRRVFDHYADLTGSPKELVQFQGHDFSARGMSGPEDAARSGAAHVLSFSGTDTVSAIDYLEDYYYANVEKELVAVSVPATEHSVTSSNILFIQRKLETEGEFNGTKRGAFGFDDRLLAEYCFIKDLITRQHPTGIVSYVSDTYDYWAVITKILPALKPEIMKRDGKFVVRPDSGDPVEVICGQNIPEVADADDAVQFLYEQVFQETPHGEHGESEPEGIFKFTDGKYYRVVAELEWDRYDKQYYFIDSHNLKTVEEIVRTPEEIGSVELLWGIFGGTVTDKGYKLLDSHIGLIYGDSITLKRQSDILQQLAYKGFASANVVLGIGSYTYQANTRDTFGSAVKSTATKVGDDLIEIFKDPKTASSKKSAKGLLRVELENGEYVLYDQQTPEQEEQGELKLVFENGKIFNQQSLAEIRSRLIG